MIDLDNPQFGALLVITIALVVPLVYSLWVDKHKKGSEDPRTVKF
ncbi:MAG TPA: hypothetical protein VNI58_00975 [Mariprofundaceae bacterium]|nr:hypothetical protein [Mariprofundaceae bacterium]